MPNSVELARTLAQGCERLGLDIDAERQARMLEYLVLMKKWNRTHNLTAITVDADMVTHHLLDSLSIIPHVRGRTVLDIGSGAGLPGIPVALSGQGISVTSLDSRGKRIEFQRYALSRLGSVDVELVHGRIEDYQPAQKFDTLVARAYASVAHFAESCEHLLTAGTRVLAMKGRHPRDEIGELPEPIRKASRVEKVDVPFLIAERHVVVIDIEH